jgi:hypothetical protein
MVIGRKLEKRWAKEQESSVGSATLTIFDKESRKDAGAQRRTNSSSDSTLSTVDAELISQLS